MPKPVAIVMDGEFGDRVGELVARDVWILDSATNLDAIERLRRDNREFQLTTFSQAVRPLAETLAGLLGMVDLHHGRYSQDPPYEQLEVYGTRANEAVLEALDEIGFLFESHTPDGFTAV